ncbi:MAG TPA: hypothetical protein IAC41_09820, partial [Candidatus Merdenecus merdavium]|nr:hypothetical protein [Candidatus Merdenecus merdavium]
TRLYEYYIETMKEDSNEVLPQMIRKYFGYNNTLSYRKKALIYANVIRHKEVDKDTYTSYRRTIEQFMEDQLEAGNINRDLALIYESFLTKAKINSRMTDTLARLFFTYELRCDNSKIRNVFVQHHELKREQVVPVIDGKAFIQLYTSSYHISLQDELGKKYGVTVPYTLHRLLEHDDEIKEYVESHSQQSGLLLYKCVEEVKDASIQKDNLMYFRKLLDSEDIKEEFRMELRKKLLDFYHENRNMEGLEYHVKQMDLDEYMIADKVKLLELLIQCGMYEQAFALGNHYGYEGVELKSLVILCSRMIWEREYEEDGDLIDLSISVFLKGRYDEVMLSYLIDLYEGPLEFMYQLWVGAESFNLDTFYLSERLLLRFMFENTTRDRAGEIFKYYCKQGGKRRIAIAYIMYESYDYVIRERQLDPLVFEYLQEHCIRDLEVDTICEIAYLKYTSRLRELTDQQEELVIGLLERYSYEGLRFGFYKGFHEELLQPYQVKERQFVEHICNPKSKVVMHYCIGERVDVSEFKQEPMVHIYEGIFSKEFTLFLGEELHYFISDELEDEYHETEVITLKGELVRSKYEHTKYQLLNRLQQDVQNKDDHRLQQDLMNYLEGDHLVNEMFTLV